MYVIKHLNLDDILNNIVNTQEEKDKKDIEWENKRKEWLNSLRYD